MGMLVKGVWAPHDDTAVANGAYRRAASTFADDIPAAVIETIHQGSHQFVLLASLSCPWSHRVLLVRAIKSLQGKLPLHLAGGPRTEGYGLHAEGPLRLNGETPRHAHQLYTQAEPAYTGRVTVPLLWDGAGQNIVSNDSGLLMRALDRVDGLGFTLAPSDLVNDINQLNTVMHDGLSNAVYRAGLAQTQSAHDAATAQVFATLDRLESRLTSSRFLFDRVLTESDLRLFATLVRFDAVYATHFRCTRYRLTDYAALWGYARDLYQWPGVAPTVDFDAILDGYYLNDGDHNPHGIIPERPRADWMTPPGRDTFGPAQLSLETGASVDARRVIKA